MDNPLAYIFDAIDKSDAENRADLMRDVWFGVLTFSSYFRCVGESSIFYSKNLQEKLNIKRICDFDLEDRAKVAHFCGFIMCSLYFGNIKEDVAVNEWLSSFPLVKGE